MQLEKNGNWYIYMCVCVWRVVGAAEKKAMDQSYQGIWLEFTSRSKHIYGMSESLLAWF